MQTISPLLSSELEMAYAIAQAGHRYPGQLETFLAQQGHAYLNLKVMEITKMVGFAITQIVQDEASLLDLVIHPVAQRRGVGRQLLLALIEQLQRRSVQTLWLEVRISNAPARALYQQLSFNEVFVRSGYYPAEKGREDALILARALTD
ncbi:ribosomal protein S18-alanine N-acetyltransferase [unidentified bacterial endosymbiont]|uniref:ribosomal protein S18-alanine N-acetyltransferase n=1 Tax=unidentified bacterial endosymbiont TaxID=2355 RepID=UPI0020A1D466|nr:ribosomal protein S18-alanine N-acetyltransferase [unidentified bacterial endosymbiont]